MAEEKTNEQLQEEIKTLKENISNLQLMNAGWQKQLERQTALYDAEVKRYKSEIEGLNNTVSSVCEKNMQQDKEINNSQNKLKELNEKLREESQRSESFKKDRDMWYQKCAEPRQRARGHFLFDAIGSLEDSIKTFIRNGYDVLLEPKGNMIETTIFESEDK